MARKQSITRTIISNEVTFICVDEKEENVVTNTVIINGNYNDKKLVKMATELVHLPIVRLKEIVRNAVTYTMDLDTFVKNALKVEDTFDNENVETE